MVIGMILENLKMFEEAIIAYEKSIELDPTWSDTYHNKGMSHFFNLGDALLLDGDRNSWTIAELKKYDEAINYYEIAI